MPLDQAKWPIDIDPDNGHLSVGGAFKEEAPPTVKGFEHPDVSRYQSTETLHEG